MLLLQATQSQVPEQGQLGGCLCPMVSHMTLAESPPVALGQQGDSPVAC